MGKTYSVLDAAELVAQLPSESRVLRAIEPSMEWDIDSYLLASIEYSLRVLIWMQTKDAQKGVNRPKMVPTPAKRADLRRKVEQTDIERIRRALGIEEV
jgi:hypothetical protein